MGNSKVKLVKIKALSVSKTIVAPHNYTSYYYTCLNARYRKKSFIKTCFIVFWSFLTEILPYILASRELPPPPLPPNFSSLTSSHLLKVTKFLVKIPRFKLLVMTEKNIFC